MGTGAQAPGQRRPAQSNLSALETGAREMGRERALVLAKALRVHPAVLLFPDFDVSEVA